MEKQAAHPLSLFPLPLRLAHHLGRLGVKLDEVGKRAQHLHSYLLLRLRGEGEDALRMGDPHCSLPLSLAGGSGRRASV